MSSRLKDEGGGTAAREIIYTYNTCTASLLDSRGGHAHPRNCPRATHHNRSHGLNPTVAHEPAEG